MHDIIEKNLNKSIELEVRAGKLITVYKSTIHSILPNKLIVTNPLENQKTALIKHGTGLKLVILEENILFTFDAQAERPHFKGKLSLLTLNLQEREEQTQKRDSYRVPTEQFPINVKIPSRTGAIVSNGVCIELSEGGMMSNIDQRLPSGGIVGISFKLPEDPHLYDIMGEAKRVVQVSHRNKTEYRTGFNFYTIPAKVRDNIVKYVFRQQQNLIRSGLMLGTQKK